MTTQTRIVAERSQYTNAGYPTFVVEHEAELFTCYVLPLALCYELENFARQAVSDDRSNITCPDEASLFGVCETIPVEFREFFALHEILRHWKKMGAPESTGREVKCASQSLSQDKKNQYIQMRRDFFRQKVARAKKKDTQRKKSWL